jgi:hypothetical protein
MDKCRRELTTYGPSNVSLEATGDPAKNMQGELCGAICRRWGGWRWQEFVAERHPPATQLEVVIQRRF